MKVFEPVVLGRDKLQNRIIRSATYEGMADEKGVPTQSYIDYYELLAKQHIGGIVTGFAFISTQGRAMQKRQAGIDRDELIPVYRKMTDAVRRAGGHIYMQIAHAGRQTRSQATGQPVVGISRKKSFYFNDTPKCLDELELCGVLDGFIKAAARAKKAGFHGVQLHAGHGYLLHQLIMPSLNRRNDRFGIDTACGVGTAHLSYVINGIRKECGYDFTLLIKVSSADDYCRPFTENNFINLIRYLDTQPLDGIEISYGTMDYAFNIFRGGHPVGLAFNVNPIFQSQPPWLNFIWKKAGVPFVKRKLKAYRPMYNLERAVLAKAHTSIPIIVVGGFRRLDECQKATGLGIDFTSASRPFIADPEWAKRIMESPGHESICINCNWCAVMCDSGRPTKCYRKNIKV